MSIKVFCDVPGCNREVDKNYTHIEVVVGRGMIGFRAAVPSPGDVCKYCAIDAFKKLDDRPGAGNVVTVSKRPVVLHVDVARYGHETTRLEVFGQTKPGVRMTRDVPNTLHELAVFIAHFAKQEGVDYITMSDRGCSSAVLDHLRSMDVPPVFTS